VQFRIERVLFTHVSSCLQLRVTAIMGATMNQHITLETDFAPAERATPEQVEKQFIAVKSSPAVQEIFNRIPHIAFVLNHERQIVYANRCLLDFLGVSENSSVSGDRPGEALRCIHSSKTEGGCGTTRNCSTCGAVLAILAAQSTGEPQMRECRITRQVDNNTDAIDLRVWTDQIKIQKTQYTIVLVMDISDEKRRRVLERVFFTTSRIPPPPCKARCISLPTNQHLQTKHPYQRRCAQWWTS
jgi:PAS domain-containing protein